MNRIKEYFADINISKKNILITLILLIGIAVGVILVQRQQILRSRADVDIQNAFEIRDNEGNSLECVDNTCKTESLDIQIKIKDLNSLISD